MAKAPPERPAAEGEPEAAIAVGVRFMVDLLEQRATTVWEAATSRNGEEMESGDKAQQELERIEKRIEHLEAAAGGNQDARRQLHSLHDQVNQLRQQIYAHMHAWQKTEMARHPQRPYLQDYIERIFTDFSEIHGDRLFGDDHAIVAGMARYHGEEVAIVGHQKGRDTKQKVFRNWGMPNPEGYRKALRVMRLAEKFGRPVFTFVDTPGAYPGLGAEERGQSEAIARNLREMARLQVPILTTITGEGGSGGALAIAVGDRVLMLENAIYSVISPEGCASIMWRDASKKDLAAEAMRVAADYLHSIGIVDAIIPEPPRGAHTDPDAAAALLDVALQEHFGALKKLTPAELTAARYQKFRTMAQFFTS